ncbi:DUF4287 domain-containing protein [Nesterenkonia alkaliphila]|uniref:DUF4287 domain-containing protein n=1 Tax=Nesterenkonia alkaliphila TaxID=1463631 RepID=A0A7K1UKW1_9MICC|nr:DUF4287 domain-containing protein [Nesterenkonia alkaliphila]MVT27099.1 DUF4287 domain-containing protein [Nesterenkonia alkaliphila]GFZ89067.1 hypothetical protein GCM10011359_17980 [Nesterenkonia alkaliphila]
MTAQESLKKIRARMVKTGERYTAARAALLAAPEPIPNGSDWVSAPPHSDTVIRENTGHSWNEWVALIDAGPGREAGHTAIAAWVVAEHGVGGWWAQGVTVGYERITGLRLPGQMPDGTFTVSKTKKLDLDSTEFRELLNNDAARADLLPGLTSAARSKPGTKAPRFAIADAVSGEDLGILQFRVESASSGAKLVVTHEKLPDIQSAEVWKQYWADWLEDLAAGG